MGNSLARKRIKATDFDYLAKNTAFVTLDIVEGYYNRVMDKSDDGKMEKEDFIEMLEVAFPERPKDRIEKLAIQLANQDGKISAANMLVLFFLFCEGKTEENLEHIFNLFDADGNKVITIEELLNMMAVFIEIGEGKNHKIDLATVMAEMFQIGDKDKNDVLDLDEFIKGMLEHPVTAKILRLKKIDAILEIL
eukprot:TRINITY_DN31234_c0_g1_i1.p1 TRINITY_DN31234_c0_g1~~TRINITY_DN31234_c0_g1_i1.p1  ORF type:complete len:193 (-),score=68.45 TRINITY_DN31234_c0_g1_i1:34-612(-)